MSARAPSAAAIRVARRPLGDRQAAARKAAAVNKILKQRRAERGALDPKLYGPDGTEVGRHPVVFSIPELLARIRAGTGKE